MCVFCRPGQDFRLQAVMWEHHVHVHARQPQQVTRSTCTGNKSTNSFDKCWSARRQKSSFLQQQESSIIKSLRCLKMVKHTCVSVSCSPVSCSSLQNVRVTISEKPNKHSVPAFDKWCIYWPINTLCQLEICWIHDYASFFFSIHLA